MEDSGAFGQNGFRFSQTSKTTTMHTDCSYGDNRPDVISLFCVNPAAHGGISQVCSIYRSMNVMRAEHPEMIETFLHDFYFHRRNTNLAGEADVHKYRLLELKGGQLSIRYKRPYMEFGHQYAGIEMPVAANRCFDELDRISGSDAAAYSYALKRGDCLIANNMWVLHNRTDYQDADEAPPRLVIRHWLQFPRDERRQSLLM
ncbi:MAG: TauD/TfdA family dioxygenase [Rhodospirillales bacterium]|nr:TauD/TfdA family dioxygenase [Rhodospirillales bacterium]